MSVFGDEVDDLLNENVLEEENNDLFGEERDGEQPDGNEAANEDAGAVPGTTIKIQPKRRTVNPRLRLTVETLRGPRGLHSIEEHFKDIKYKGKGHEKDDLDEVLKRLQHWGHRMYPTYKFDDVIGNIERLGRKKELQVHMSRYRLDMLDSNKVQSDADAAGDDDDDAQVANEEPFDEFDALLDEQIAISKIAPRTPSESRSKYGPMSSANSTVSSSSFGTPSFSKANASMSTPYSGVHYLGDTSDLAIPLPNSQPSTPAVSKFQQLTAEQMARIAENRRKAQERLAAKKIAQQKAKESL